MIILKNKRRQMQVFNLDSPFFVRNRNDTKWGQACSMTFLALEKKEVSEAVLSCAEIKAAIAAGILRNLGTAKEVKADVGVKVEEPLKGKSKRTSRKSVAASPSD